MREILFKAKRLDNGEWIEGYYWVNSLNNHLIRVVKHKADTFTTGDYEVDPDTLCQFTGTNDMDDNKIWENNIVNLSKENPTMNDNVLHPAHYNQSGIECVEAIKAATVGKAGIEAFCVGNAIKYLWRYEKKNGLEDVKKAQFYINRLIQELEQNNSNTP